MDDQPADGRVIGLVVHPTRPVAESVRTLLDAAGRLGATVVARDADVGRVADDRVTLLDQGTFLERVGIVVSLGGDGTMLGAMRLLVGRDVPVLGVNHGHLGFLVEIAPPDLAAAVDRLVAGDFTLEPHANLDITVTGGPDGVTRHVAFNDVVLTPAAPPGGTVVDLLVNDARYGYYRCDAVVACTPTGSTAYNYAAGGPVLSPSAATVAVTPVAPMSGINRAVVFGGTDTIGLHNPARTALRITVDGTDAGRLPPDGTLSVTVRAGGVNVVRLDPTAHAQRSRVKLSLLDLPLRPDQLLDLVPPRLRDQARHAGGLASGRIPDDR
ncbi:NAD(+)/NADH kinase [Polymorphospora lycopeni]|uniref:NAD kinase n=1 Tax=Polymorphospora lycopeni TaxID=3140240 RepID=A0ABV5CM34_9ACTN